MEDTKEYEIVNTMTGVMITGYSGNEYRLYLPKEINGCPVQAIGKKAFLGCISLHELLIPESVQLVEDWAFASCSALEQVRLQGRQTVFGRGVFKGCSELQRIKVPDSPLGTGHLMAGAITLLDAPYLLDAENAGGQHWFEQWDARMKILMHKADDEDFQKMIQCGEEECTGLATSVDYYKSLSRRDKARIAFLRLRYPYALAKEEQAYLEEYLRTHTKGSVSEGLPSEEAWTILSGEHENDLSMYRLFQGIGGITAQNCQEMIADIGDRQPEAKAYLLKENSAMNAEHDFFDEFAAL